MNVETVAPLNINIHVIAIFQKKSVTDKPQNGGNHGAYAYAVHKYHIK